MAKKTLTDVFGASATQDINELIVQKAPMVTNGLTADANNSAQSLQAALVQNWSLVQTVSNRTTNPDETVVCTYDGVTSRTESGNTYAVRTYRVQFFQLTPPTDIDPDNY